MNATLETKTDFNPRSFVTAQNSGSELRSAPPERAPGFEPPAKAGRFGWKYRDYDRPGVEESPLNDL